MLVITRTMAVFAAILFTVNPALANEDNMRSLSPVKIRSFIDKMTEKTMPGGRLDDKEVVQYLNAHLSSEGTFNSSLTFRIHGYDDQTQEVSVTKEQFIQNILAGRRDIRKYDSSVKVTEIVVAKDKRSAMIKTITREKGEMPVEKGKYLPFEGSSTCSQEIRMLGEVPQISGADCQSLIEVKQR